MTRWFLRGRSVGASERGVAMVTVLFIGAVMTAVTSVAAFSTIQEFRQGRDDRKASEALAYAEAGVDRFIKFIKTSGSINYNDLNSAGCGVNPPLSIPSGKIGNGLFTASLTVYNPFASNPVDRFPPAACNNRPVTPHPGQGGDLTYFVITSRGTHPDAARVIRQIISVEPIGLPVGLYARNFILKAHPAYNNVSMIAAGIITDRINDSFKGNDSYNLVSDLYPEGVVGRNLSDPAPAAAHAGEQILLKLSSTPEFTGSTLNPGGYKNCLADRTPGRSIWDTQGFCCPNGAGPITSGCPSSSTDPTAPGYPKSSVFNYVQPPPPPHEDYLEGARSSGIFCSFPGVGGSGATTCTSRGVPFTYSENSFVTAMTQLQLAGVRNFIVYVEYRSGTATQNNFSWDGSVWGCNPDRLLNRSVVVDIRNGGFSDIGAGGDKINGAIFAEGDFNTTGRMTFNGSIHIGGTASFGGSSELVTLDPCWVKNFPTTFLKVLPGHWSEVDR